MIVIMVRFSGFPNAFPNNKHTKQKQNKKRNNDDDENVPTKANI